jgi:UDPglucose 6-dehydrogenase
MMSNIRDTVSDIDKNRVICVDLDKNKVNELNAGRCTIHEDGMQEHLVKATQSGNLFFTCDYRDIADSDIVFVAVGTPSNPDGGADLSAVYESVLEVARVCRGEIVIKSTVPPGTCAALQRYLKDKGYHNCVSSNPEFLREGSAIYDFLNPDRVIIGVDNQKSLQIIKSMYNCMIERGINVFYTDTCTSELIKYASNSFLATKVAFINEMSDLCESLGANVDDLSYGMGLDKRIGNSYLTPGPGFGGSCFPKDLSALLYIALSNSVPLWIVDAAIESNSDRYLAIRDKISAACCDGKDENMAGKRVAILGLTFKAGTDDTRCSPAIEIIKHLANDGAIISAYDPVANIFACEQLIAIHRSVEDACIDADVVVIMTEWGEIRNANWESIISLVRSPIVVDTRRLLSGVVMTGLGFKYYRIGEQNPVWSKKNYIGVQ